MCLEREREREGFFERLKKIAKRRFFGARVHLEFQVENRFDAKIYNYCKSTKFTSQLEQRSHPTPGWNPDISIFIDFYM